MTVPTRSSDSAGPSAGGDPGPLLELLGPALNAETLDELLVIGARVACALTEATAGAVFITSGREVSSEVWHAESEAVRTRVRPHLRGLAIEAAGTGVTVVTPFPDGTAMAETPLVVILSDRGKRIGVLCAACPERSPGHAAQAAARLELLAPVLARQITIRQDAVAARSTLTRYERWFKQLDQHIRVLDRERQKFAAIVNQSDTYVFTADPDGIIRWANRVMAACAPSEHPRGWVGRSCHEVWAHFGERETPQRTCPVTRALASNQPEHREFRQADDHAVRNFYVTALPIRGPEGGTQEVLAIVQDLSGLESLRLAEQRLKTVVSNSPIVLFALDREGVFTLSEGRGLEALGRGSGELTGVSALEVYRDHPEVIGHLRRALAGEEFSAVVDIEGVTFETLYSPLRTANGELAGTIGVATDISERRQLENQLRHAHKMEGIGRLAGGVAHDFNNLLTVIMGNAELLLNQLRPGHPLRSCAEEMQKAGAQGALLTRQLLSFSRRDQATPRQLDLNVIVVEMEGMLRRIIGEDIEIDTVLSSETAMVLVDRSQIEQVMMNLTLNARDAMPDGGRITLHVDSNEPSDIVFTVSDNGAGMDEEIKSRLFEPFFTTKERGKGTGLGLALVQGIIQGAGGTITIDSREGQGTTVRITLPRSAADITPERRAA